MQLRVTIKWRHTIQCHCTYILPNSKIYTLYHWSFALYDVIFHRHHKLLHVSIFICRPPFYSYQTVNYDYLRGGGGELAPASDSTSLAVSLSATNFKKCIWQLHLGFCYTANIVSSFWRMLLQIIQTKCCCAVGCWLDGSFGCWFFKSACDLLTFCSICQFFPIKA